MRTKDEFSGKYIIAGERPLAEKALSVRVDPTVDQWIRSLPDRPDWLRKTIEAAARQEMRQRLRESIAANQQQSPKS